MFRRFQILKDLDDNVVRTAQIGVQEKGECPWRAATFLFFKHGIKYNEFSIDFLNVGTFSLSLAAQHFSLILADSQPRCKCELYSCSDGNSQVGQRAGPLSFFF